MDKFISNEELYKLNTIGAKVFKQNRKFSATIGETITKEINRTKYLKICWMCGKPYESYKLNSYACSVRCSQNIYVHRKKKQNPIANMSVLTKERNVKEIKEQFGYR